MRLVFLGDSLTEYGDWQRLLPRHPALNLGRAGETVEGLLQRVKAIGIIPPDYLFIMSGINNIAAGETGFLASYRELTEHCASLCPSSRIVIQSMLPVCVDWIDRDAITAANEGLKALSRDCQTAYLDLYLRFTDARGEAMEACYLDDGIHLSASGYDRWAGAIEEFLSGPESRYVSL